MADVTLTTNTMSNAAGVINQAIGRVVSDAGATPVAQTFSVGFKPRMVRWINITDRITDEWYEGMAADSAVETAAAGTRTLETSGGITVNVGAAATPTVSASFTVHADLVPASKTYAWEVYG